MATFVMEVFHYQDATSDKLWAICIDGSRVITHWCKRGAQRFQGGAPIKIKPGLDASQAYQRAINQQLREGYRSIGTRTIADGVMQEAGTAPAKPQAPADGRLFPDAYTELDLLDGWHEKVRQIAATLQLGAVDDGEGGLNVDLGTALPMRFAPGKASIVKTYHSDGPMGRLLLLALGMHMKSVVFDSNGKERTAAWLREDPAGFESDSLSGEKVQELAEQAGLVMARLRFKQDSKRAGLFV